MPVPWERKQHLAMNSLDLCAESLPYTPQGGLFSFRKGWVVGLTDLAVVLLQDLCFVLLQ